MSGDELYAYLDQVFEWDRMKAARNVIKHRVRFPEAASVSLMSLLYLSLIQITLMKKTGILCLAAQSGQMYCW